MKRDTPAVSPEEMKLVHAVASSFRVTDREELEAELSAKLILLKMRASSEIRDWPAYVAKFLYNKAHNFARDERARHRRESAAFDAAVRAVRTTISEVAVIELEITFHEVWRRLRRNDRCLWLSLAEESGNRSMLAARLGIHRNTLLGRLRRIRREIVRLGLSAELCSVSIDRAYIGD